MWPGKYLQALIYFQEILCKKESEEISMLIQTNFDSFDNTYLMKVAIASKF